jgi:hypothetical protein
VEAVLDQVSWFASGYALLVALVAGYAAYRWRARPPWLASLAWMLEFLVGLRSVLGLLSLGTVPPESMATHVGYLLAAPCVVPLALQSVRDDDGPWSLGVIGVAAVAVAVLSLRILATL